MVKMSNCYIECLYYDKLIFVVYLGCEDGLFGFVCMEKCFYFIYGKNC